MKSHLIIPIISLSIIIAFIWNIPSGKFSETLPIILTISEPRQIGVHTTKEPQKIFDFGTTFAGTKVQKMMNLTRGNEPPAKIHITVEGEMQNWIILNKNDFILDEPARVIVTVEIPDNARKGTYTGNISIDYINTYGMQAIQFIQALK